MTSNALRYNDRMLKAGDKAPTFKLPSDQGKALSLNDFAGSYVVLYFYPKDDTPGCTRQAQAFTEMQRAFSSLGATVLGVSRDSVDRHEKFRKKYDLRVPLLSDEDLTVHKLYGTYGTKMMYGRETQGTIRTTYVVGPTGRIVAVFPKVKVEGHAEKVLDLLREVQNERAGVSAETAKPTVVRAAPAKKTAVAPKKAAPKKAAPKNPVVVTKSAPAKKRAASRTNKG